MKVTVYIKEITKGCLPHINRKGDWIDLKIAQDINLKKGDFSIIPLGVAMKLPKGMEAIIAARSSLYKNYKVIIANGIGIIDNSYNGDKDQWGAPLLAMEDTIIPKGTRICQFRLQLSQFASVWNKLKWLFITSFVYKYTDNLNTVSRGGFGSTGTK